MSDIHTRIKSTTRRPGDERALFGLSDFEKASGVTFGLVVVCVNEERERCSLILLQWSPAGVEPPGRGSG